MAEILTNGSLISCTVNGTVPTSANHKLKVFGQSVLTIADITGRSVTGCTTPTDPNTSSKQCLKVDSASGTSAKLKVNGTPVVNSNFSGSTDGSINALSAAPNQTKLKA